MALDSKTTFIRAVSGAVYVLLVAGACISGKWGVSILSAVFGVLGILEFRKMKFPFLRKDLWLNIYDCIGVVLLTFGMLIIPMLIWIFWLIGRFLIFLISSDEDMESSLFTDLAGQIYIGVPLGIMTATALFYDSGWLILALFILIWVNDTGAFLFGSLLGKHKLYERISPKKTWEGFWGGCISTITVAIIIGATNSELSYLPSDFTTVSDHLILWSILGVIVSISATLGDLFESSLKRISHIKDSGNIIPGHGGILDRIDSLLFVIPISIGMLWCLYLI